VNPKEPLEVRCEVTPNLSWNVGAFNSWEVYGVSRPIPHLQLHRETSEMARRAASVAYGDRRPSAKDINRSSDLLGGAAKQGSSRVLRRDAERIR
jgi:hypothetical protein